MIFLIVNIFLQQIKTYFDIVHKLYCISSSQWFTPNVCLRVVIFYFLQCCIRVKSQDICFDISVVRNNPNKCIYLRVLLREYFTVHTNETLFIWWFFKNSKISNNCKFDYSSLNSKIRRSTYCKQVTENSSNFRGILCCLFSFKIVIKVLCDQIIIIPLGALAIFFCWYYTQLIVQILQRSFEKFK